MPQSAKEERSQKLLLRAIDLDSRAETDYLRCPIEDKETNLAIMRKLSADGTLKTVAIERGGVRAGSLNYVVYEHPEKGRVLWIIGIGADSDESADVELYAGIGEQVCSILESEGCAWCRAEAPRAGIYRKLLRIGFIPARVEMYATREMFEYSRIRNKNTN